MKKIALHLTVIVVLMPCVLVFNVSEEIWVNFLGIIYVSYLLILWNESDAVRKFVRRYYHEILRIENGL